MNNNMKRVLVVGCTYAIVTNIAIGVLVRDNKIIKQDMIKHQQEIIKSHTAIQDRDKLIRNLKIEVEKTKEELTDIKTKRAKEEAEKSKIANLITKHNPTLQPKQVSTISNAVIIFSDKYNVSKEEILAIMKAESNFTPNLIGTCEDSGLMQLTPPTYKMIAKEMGIRNFDILDINTNIEMGTYFISSLKSNYGKYAFIVYNQGFSKPLNDNTYNTLAINSTSYLYKINKYTNQFKEELKCI